jgi:hypothetical protein
MREMINTVPHYNVKTDEKRPDGELLVSCGRITKREHWVNMYSGFIWLTIWHSGGLL